MRTSTLPRRSKEIEGLLEQALSEARRALDSNSTNAEDSVANIETLIRQLSDALTDLPSTMQKVVESMQ